jgi:hypothetical protein
MASIGSREYWRDPKSYPQDWESRAVQAARFVPTDSIVLDLGCGPHMALRRHLPINCPYVPADLYPWNPEVCHVDIDANIFPTGTFGCVVLLGVIEYLTRPQLAFRFAQGCALTMIISYCHPLTGDREPRRQAGWINAYSQEELGGLVSEYGWRIAHSQTFHRSVQTHQMIHALSLLR